MAEKRLQNEVKFWAYRQVSGTRYIERTGIKNVADDEGILVTVKENAEKKKIKETVV